MAGPPSQMRAEGEHMKKINYTAALTHAGVFHADDVFSAALLKILNPDIQIQRVMKVPDDLSEDTIVFDIGFGRYDHHQKDVKVRNDGVKYAAFGLLWAEFGKLICNPDSAARFDADFIEIIDCADNGGALVPMSMAISSFVPNWDEKNQNMDEAFFTAVEFAREILMREFRRIEAAEMAEQEVRNALEKSDGEIVLLERFCPWPSVLIPSTAKFVIFPSLRGGYNAQAIPTTLGGRDQKCPFPVEWAGKSEEELNEIIPGLTFCHPGRFMIAASTVDTAITACRVAMQ